MIALTLWWRFRAWWSALRLRVAGRFHLQSDKISTIRRLPEIPELYAPSALAMHKVYKACPWIPPDTVSAGIQNGGDALFFRHDEGLEIFIGRNFDHAADELIQWLKLQGSEIQTKTTTKMNRRERRAYEAHFRRKGRQR